MFQLLVKLSLFFCLLVCANSNQRKLRTPNRSNSTSSPTFVPDLLGLGIPDMPEPSRTRRPSAPKRSRTSSPTFVPDLGKPSLLTPSPKDYENLYTAIATDFAESEDMSMYLRFSLYELVLTWVEPNGCRGHHYDYEGNFQTLQTYVRTKFKKLDFSKRGNIYHVTRSLFITLF